MKPREFKLNMALAPVFNIARMRRYAKDLVPSFDPAENLQRRRFRAAAIRRKTGGFPGR